jgi:Fe2+ transport system protein FeoA
MRNMTKFEKFMDETPAVGLLIARDCAALGALGLTDVEVVQHQLAFGCELRDRLISAGLARGEALDVVNAAFLAAEREIAGVELCLTAEPEAVQ